jgi:hypothetical protein
MDGLVVIDDCNGYRNDVAASISSRTGDGNKFSVIAITADFLLAFK